MSENLTASELVRLVQRVFRPTDRDTGLALIVDLPDPKLADNDYWRQRRILAAGWAEMLSASTAELGLPRVTLAWYPNAGGNNADLPADCRPASGFEPLHYSDDLAPLPALPFAELFATHSLVIAPTELSATAPMKVAARSHPLRAATMPGFLPTMVPALRLDYGEINRRVMLLKELVDPATAARIVLAVDGEEKVLDLDLRHREAHASGGLFPTNGVAGNLPSGETYVVPYEGEIAGDPSASAGELPVQFGDEVVIYRIAGNKAVEVLSTGPQSKREAALIADEPAYANLAELGLGVLGDFGLAPTGSILLDEKLGLHIAFGRSDHFGGDVGPGDFSSPEAVVHLDRVYIPQMQPRISVESVTLERPDGPLEIIRDGSYGDLF